MLKISRFVQGKDEEAWLGVYNIVYGQRWDQTPMSVDEMVAMEKSPEFEAKGRFIARVDSMPVGIVNAYVDKLREEKKGFMRSFGVIPSSWGKGIEEKLVNVALKDLKRRGMKVVQAVADGEDKKVIRLWRSLGFRLVRKFSLMTRDLSEIHSGSGKNVGIVLKPLQIDDDEDLKSLNWLDNECFREHFNWRPNPVERTMYFVRQDPFFKKQEWYFALLNQERVGYVGLGIDEAHNTERKAKRGWILDIGVLKPHRRKGIGTALMIHGMCRLKAMGMTTAMLGVDDRNITKAICLYQKVGFKTARKDCAYEKKIG